VKAKIELSDFLLNVHWFVGSEKFFPSGVTGCVCRNVVQSAAQSISFAKIKT
jgi:hypothetical protein